MPTITNPAQLKKVLLDIGENLINQVSKDIVDENVSEPSDGISMGYLQKMIWEKTYTNDYFPNVAYYTPIKSKKYALLQEYILTDEINEGAMPTFQFFRAFRWRPIKRGINDIKKQLFYDWGSMQYNGDTFLHGNPDMDMREQLADILNVSGSPGSFTRNKMRQPYWDITINELFNSGGLKSLFDMYFTMI